MAIPCALPACARVVLHCTLARIDSRHRALFAAPAPGTLSDGLDMSVCKYSCRALSRPSQQAAAPRLQHPSPHRRRDRLIARFTPVPHPSHLEDELVDMERKLKGSANTAVSSRQGRSQQGPLVKHKQHGQHHWFSLQEPRDAEQLQQAAKHIMHCLLRGADGGGLCTVSFGAHQAQELSALLCQIQEQLLQSSPSSVLAFQPPLPAQQVLAATTGSTGGSSSRQPMQHQHQPGQLAVQLQVIGLQHLPNLHSAACALSSQEWGSPARPAGTAAAPAGTYPPHPSYAAIFTRQLSECLPCIPVGTCSDQYATAASLCKALLSTRPAVMAVSASPAAHEAMLESLTRARRHLAAEAADVDLLTLMWPLNGHVHWKEAAAAAGGGGGAAGAGALGSSDQVAAGLGVNAPTAAAGMASKGSNGSSKAAAAHSQQAELLTWQQWQQQQVAGAAAAAGHGVTKDLGVLVLPWWGPAA